MGMQVRFLARLIGVSALAVGVTVVVSRAQVALVASALTAIVGYQVYDFVRRFAHAITRHFEAALLSAAVAATQLAVLVALRSSGHLTLENACIAIAMTMALLSLGAATRFVPSWSSKGQDPTLGNGAGHRLAGCWVPP